MKKQAVVWFEPVFFLFFGLMHTSRVWAFFDRDAYARFWLGLLYGRGALYFIGMGIMALLCVAGMVLFFRNRGRNPKWRWVYLLGGGYVLFDLFAIAVRWPVWLAALDWMFDTTNPFWTLLWGVFVAAGLACLALGVWLATKMAGKYGTN